MVESPKFGIPTVRVTTTRPLLKTGSGAGWSLSMERLESTFLSTRALIFEREKFSLQCDGKGSRRRSSQPGRFVVDITVIAPTHRRYPETLPDVLPLFAGIVLITHRELIARLLNTEPDWPWQKPTPKPLPSESITSRSSGRGDEHCLCRICATSMEVSRTWGYRLIKRAWRQIHDDIEGQTSIGKRCWPGVRTLLETAG